MKQITRKVEYALMALKHMTDRQSHPLALVTAKEVSDSLTIPFDATARVLQIMTQNGLLRSEQGVSGGYSLNKNLQEVSLRELVEMIEGPSHLVKCFSESSACEIQGQCNIRTPIHRLDQQFQNFFERVRLHELIVGPSASLPQETRYEQ